MKFLRFSTGDDQRLVALEAVVECIPTVQLEESGREGSDHFRGLLHYRGRVIPVFDPGESAGEELKTEWFLVVVQLQDEELALVARDVHDIVECPRDQLREVDVGSGNAMSVVSVGGEVLTVVDTERLRATEVGQ